MPSWIRCINFINGITQNPKGMLSLTQTRYRLRDVVEGNIHNSEKSA